MMNEERRNGGNKRERERKEKRNFRVLVLHTIIGVNDHNSGDEKGTCQRLLLSVEKLETDNGETWGVGRGRDNANLGSFF